MKWYTCYNNPFSLNRLKAISIFSVTDITNFWRRVFSFQITQQNTKNFLRTDLLLSLEWMRSPFVSEPANRKSSLLVQLFCTERETRSFKLCLVLDLQHGIRGTGPGPLILRAPQMLRKFFQLLPKYDLIYISNEILHFSLHSVASVWYLYKNFIFSETFIFNNFSIFNYFTLGNIIFYLYYFKIILYF